MADGVFGIMIIVGLGCWGMSRLGRKYDNDGRIKEAAKGGIIRMIGRWMR
jgi:hypothetical protein